MRHFIYWAGLCIAMGCFTSCKDEESPEVVTAGESSVITLPADAGSREVEITAAGAWSVERDSLTRQWINIEGKRGEGNGSFRLVWRNNEAFPRVGKLVVKLANRLKADTLYVRQYGISPIVEFASATGDTVPSGGRAVQVAFRTNIPAADTARMAVQVVYEGTKKDWVSGPVFTKGMDTLSAMVAANVPGEGSRKARVEVAYTDAWGTRYAALYPVSQVAAGGSAATKSVSFADVRGLISEASGAKVIDQDIAIEGILLTQPGDPNVAANPYVTPTAVDVEENYKTAYVQSLDGRYGFALKFDKPTDNVGTRFSKVKLWLKGVELVKEDAPGRYTLRGLNGSAYMNAEAGTALQPKERTIATLTPEDVYTYVALKDCEIGVRKGSYTPVNEGYTSLYGSLKVDMYPLLVRDVQGTSLFLMTNMDCPYRRNGNALPMGTGTLSGVIVHESYQRFERDGNIGLYQIRPLRQSDIAIGRTPGSNSSVILAEWSRHNLSGTVEQSTAGSGTLWHTAVTPSKATDFGFLGPMTGVQAEDNKGAVSSAAGMAFAATQWWNSAKNAGESWMIAFSTQGVQASHIALQLAVMNGAIGAPRYWEVHWATSADATVWNPVGTYTVPDVVNWGNTLPEQLCGWKNINMELPLALLGHDTVCLRLRPAANKAGTATSYEGATINNTKTNVLSYVGIRYNK